MIVLSTKMPRLMKAGHFMFHVKHHDVQPLFFEKYAQPPLILNTPPGFTHRKIHPAVDHSNTCIAAAF